MNKGIILVCISHLLLFSSFQQRDESELTLNPLFTDHMVLQQQQDVAIWGTSNPGEVVVVSSSWEHEVVTKAGQQGDWRITIPTPKAGGPYTITIKSPEISITIKDVLIGEVWLASGQSNMEMPLKGFSKELIDNSQQEIAAANYPGIRMFTVAKNFMPDIQTSLEGEWQVCSPGTVKEFSATGYFFAQKLHKVLDIPIGIIHSSWGGTVAEAWTSREGLKDFSEFLDVIEPYGTPDMGDWVKLFKAAPVPTSLATFEKLDVDDKQLSNPNFDDSNWPKVKLPAKQCHSDNFIPHSTIKQGLHGVFWYRKNARLKNIRNDYILMIEAIDDADIIYVNGQKVGSTWDWQSKRVYNVPKSILKKGDNLIAIKQFDGAGGSAIVGPMSLESKGIQISLEGTWSGLFYADIHSQNLVLYGIDGQEQLSERPHITEMGPNQLPSSLFNAMINPLIPYTIKGAIWYQGESNVGRAEQYETLFPAMINDWRMHWNSNFPFYFVQIAPFDYGNELSPLLREAQRLSLNIENTGMAITMDIGNPTSIHPGNKQDVGDRLSRLALSDTYGKSVVASGPLYKNHQVDGANITIVFDHIGDGLTSKDADLAGFEIAGLNKMYVPAQAIIVDNKIEVSSSEIEQPRFVRYGWKDFIMGSLFNKEGLPASSFSTEK